jgi:hypothetical protein
MREPIRSSNEAHAPFQWHTVDVGGIRQQYPDWQRNIIAVATHFAFRDVLRPPHSTSREASDIHELPILRVHGFILEQYLPGITALYETTFRQMAEEATGRQLTVGRDFRHRLNLNVQRHNSDHPERGRYENHVDTNPVEGLLYVTTHPEGSGGALIVSNNPDAQSVAEVEEDATRIYPEAGRIVFFDATRHPHYVDALKDPNDLRVAVGMNYYTADHSEAMRPPDLDAYLAGAA